MDRHAFLIICHQSDYNLQALIKSIDDECNDIFILVDKKSKNFDFHKVKDSAKMSKIQFSPRIKVVWGGYSLVRAEVTLFEFALNQVNYAWFHLLSGVDMCLKKQDEINRFFENHPDKIFVDFSADQKWLEQANNRIKYYNIEAGRNKLLRRLNKVYVLLQKLIGINRIKHADFEVAGGSQWCSLPRNFVKYLITRKDWIEKVFKKTFCCDEIFIQTLLVNSPFKDNVFASVEGIPCYLRYIDWKRGSPYVFNENDFDELKASSAFFARKFTYTTENKLIEKILEYNGLI